MTSIAVCSSVYGGYDQVAAPVEQDVDVEWVLVTDQMPLTYPVQLQHRGLAWPWKVIEEPRPDLHPRLAAKVAKCRPDLYTDADVTIWVDGHLRITHPGFVGYLAGAVRRGQPPIAQLRHPQRQLLADEVALSARLPKYAGLPIRQQVAHYLEGGYPDGWGLWATGLIVRRSTPQMAAFGDAWLAEQVRWTVQDQLSEAPLLWRLGIRPVDLPGPLLGHPMFDLGRHEDGTG